MCHGTYSVPAHRSECLSPQSLIASPLAAAQGRRLRLVPKTLNASASIPQLAARS
jgi:hypothetical protein